MEIVERIQGRKFLVKENSVPDLEAGCEEPGKRFYNQVRLSLVQGWEVDGQSLNQMFPEVGPVTVEHFVEKWWDSVELSEPTWEADQSFM